MSANLPKKFTPQVITQILEAKRRGATAKEAAKAAGISSNPLYGWLSRGRQEGTGVFAKFVEAYERAEHDGRNFKLRELLDYYDDLNERVEAANWGELPDA